MNDFEKVEKLIEKANVSYEEARAALEQTNWDLLDAIVLLERQGKTRGPEQSSYSTSYEEQERYARVEDIAAEQERAHKNHYGFRKAFHVFFRKIRNNAMQITRKGEEVVRLPLWILVIALLVNWKAVVAVVIISLFFDCRYHFVGKDEMSSMNSFMDMAGDAVEHVKDDFI